MKTFRIDVMLAGTLYIKAESAEQVAELVDAMRSEPIELGNKDFSPFADPFADDEERERIKLSPAMTCYGAWPGCDPEENAE